MEKLIVNNDNFNENKNVVIESLKVFYPGDWIDENNIFKTLQNEGAFYCFLFDDNGKVVSYCRGVKVWNRKTIFIIRQVETMDKYRGKGYAGICYKAVENYISKFYRNAKKIITFVDNENQNSIRFHEKNGYTINDKVSKYLRTLYGWDSAYMFEKNINSSIEKLEIKDNIRGDNERML